MTGPQALTAAHYRRGNDLAACHCSGWGADQQPWDEPERPTL